MGQNLPAFINHLVLAGEKRATGLGQGALHAGVTRERLGLVVACGKHRLRLQFRCQLHDLLAGHGVAHDQPGAGFAAQFAQAGVQFHQRFADEFHPPIQARQARQNVGVEDEDTVNLGTLAQCQVQRGVVRGAQIAAKPHQAGVKS